MNRKEYLEEDDDDHKSLREDEIREERQKTHKMLVEAQRYHDQIQFLDEQLYAMRFAEKVKIDNLRIIIVALNLGAVRITRETFKEGDLR